MASAPSTPKAGWEVKTLGEVCELISGQHILADDYNSARKGIGYLTGPADFGETNPIVSRWTENPKATAKRDDILITVKGSGVGKINLLGEDEVAISRQLMAIRLKETSSLKFIYFFMSMQFAFFQDLSTGAAIPGISRKDVLNLLLNLPPLPEQERIVGILDEAFEGIAAATAQAEKNLHNARELFQSVLQSTFSQKGDDWVEKKLPEISSVQTGKHDANHAKEDGKYRFYTCAYQHLRCETNRFSGPAIILPGNGANVGELFYYDGEFDAYQRTYVINEISIYQKYLFYHLKAFWRERNLNKQFGSATNFLKIGNFKSYIISYPSNLPTQQAIVEKLDALSEETKALEAIYERKQSALAELKQSLLQKAFAGEL